jgi:hypothetical protein
MRGSFKLMAKRFCPTAFFPDFLIFCDDLRFYETAYEALF